MSEGGDAKSVGGIAPYGYRWEDGRLVIEPAEAPVRKLIYELFVKHHRKKTVARILNDLGHRTRRGSIFYDTTILRLLTDTTAKGAWEVDGTEVSVEPLVTSELWERANRLLGERKPAKRPANLFSGVVHCECGGRMIISGNSEKYFCPDCKRRILAADLETIFHSQLSSFVGSDCEGIYENWSHIAPEEKRTLIEQICERIVIGASSIEIEFGCEPETEVDSPVTCETLGSRLPATAIDEDTDSEPSIDEPLLSEEKAAEFIDVSKMTMLRKRKAGEIGYFQIGNLIKYSKEKHLIPYLAKREK